LASVSALVDAVRVVGMITFFAGLLWLVIELFQVRSRRATVVREREIY
jgi:hypothetical protein